MKETLSIILFGMAMSVGPVVCIAAAFYLALHGKPGWGWFLAIAPFVGANVKFRKPKIRKPKNEGKTEDPESLKKEV